MPRPVRLLDLPEGVLLQIIDFLIPSHDAPSVATSVRHIFNLSQCNVRLRDLISPCLRCLDFSNPQGYGWRAGRTTPLHATYMSSLIRRAAPYCTDLRLPPRFTHPTCPFPEGVRIPNLRKLAFAPHPHLLFDDARRFFNSHPRLVSLELRLPTSQLLDALNQVALPLKQLRLTLVVAKAVFFEALSTCLRVHAPTLEDLSISLLCSRPRDGDLRRLIPVQAGYYPSIPLRTPKAALSRISSLLFIHAARLHRLRALSISTSPEDISPVKQTSIPVHEFFFCLYILRFAIHEPGPTPPTAGIPLKRLKLHISLHELGASIALIKPLVWHQVDVEFVFPEVSAWFRAGSSERRKRPVPIISGFVVHPNFALYYPAVAKRVEERKTLTVFTQHPPAEDALTPGADQPSPSLPQGIPCERLRLSYGDGALQGLSCALRYVARISVHAPVSILELPADLVALGGVSGDSTSCTVSQCESMRGLLLYDFGDDKLPTSQSGKNSDELQILMTTGGLGQKAIWFLRGLPNFLMTVAHVFPNLEYLCMDESRVPPRVVDESALFETLTALDDFEKILPGVDVSTVRGELEAWAI